MALAAAFPSSTRSRAATLATGLFAAWLMAAPGPANADDLPSGYNPDFKCSEFREAKSGVTFGADLSAMDYSADNKGAVGIAIYSGALDDKPPEYWAQLLVNTIGKYAPTECFISSKKVNGGTGIAFFIDGVEFREGNPYNVAEATEPTNLRAVIGGAIAEKLAKASSESPQFSYKN